MPLAFREYEELAEVLFLFSILEKLVLHTNSFEHHREKYVSKFPVDREDCCPRKPRDKMVLILLHNIYFFKKNTRKIELRFCCPFPIMWLLSLDILMGSFLVGLQVALSLLLALVILVQNRGTGLGSLAGGGGGGFRQNVAVRKNFSIASPLFWDARFVSMHSLSPFFPIDSPHLFLLFMTFSSFLPKSGSFCSCRASCHCNPFFLRY